MVTGIVLAGGMSSRASCNKMILKLDGDYLINKTIQSMQKYVDEIVVVTGHYHHDIVEAVKPFDTCRIVHNQHYKKGMFSSVKAGVEHARGDIFIIPGDCPSVCPSVYEKLLNSEGDVRVPTHKGRKGHPIFIQNNLKDPLLEFDDTSNLKVFRDAQSVQYVETKCRGILKDVDTLADYTLLIERID